ncbi:hypothetical protein EG68_09388 [Paragonimus skrjabini miyazakii]|uniref:GDP-mannose 4,6-dehydratase n=1 Tax=Paragonimus skrjabini miyazakii TaxID=59628 RepID=A0A8S9YQ58_9TREM|nr:hypothetical protein EG68_09388 [Paragonimus skrjabini miyazakii]
MDCTISYRTVTLNFYPVLKGYGYNHISTSCQRQSPQIHILLLMAVCSGIVDKRKIALITGVTGQVTFSICFFTEFKDGAYLSELLLCKGYEVHGIIRRSSTFNTSRIDHIYEAQKNASPRIFFLHYGDMTDSSSLIRIISQVKPDEIYNLAAQSHVKVLSFVWGEVVAMGTLRLLDAIPSSSELYGKVSSSPQHECTPFHPRSPYAVAKLYAYWIVVNYRESYGLFACNGILFNHESPRRGETFVTRKITRAVSRIKMGLQNVLELGNLNAERDWGFAGDYVRAMWQMLQQEQPDDYVIATGEKHTVREFTTLAFAHVGIHIQWIGEGLNEVGVDSSTDIVRVRVEPRYFRPAEVDLLVGDSSKARTKFNWEPSCNFHQLVQMMMDADLRAVSSELQ